MTQADSFPEFILREKLWERVWWLKEMLDDYQGRPDTQQAFIDCQLAYCAPGTTQNVLEILRELCSFL